MATIFGTERELMMNAATPRIYRAKFGKDIIVQMDDMYARLRKDKDKDKEESFTGEEIEAMENLIYVCNRQAEPEQPEDIIEWLSGFEVGAITGTYGIILDMWQENLQQTSKSKKKTENQ